MRTVTVAAILAFASCAACAHGQGTASSAASMSLTEAQPLRSNGGEGQDNTLASTPTSNPIASSLAIAEPCGPAGRFWFKGEYLLWWIRDGRLPDLVTTATPGASPLPGVLGQPGTVVLVGEDSGLREGARSGGRFVGGLWLNEAQTLGLEASYFFLGAQTAQFDSSSTGAPGSAVITRPFFDVLTSQENAQLVAFPGVAGGSIHVSNSSRLQGVEINSLFNVRCGPDYRIDLLCGFHYLDLTGSLGIAEITRVIPALPQGAPFFGGATITMSDQFDGTNRFYGAQIGGRAEWRIGRWFVELLGKVAFGETNQTVDIRGKTVNTAAVWPADVTAAGFLATASNSGHFGRSVFAAAPEVGIHAGWQITEFVRASIGYSFLYWSSVVRPADQVDVGLSGTQIPTDTRFNPQTGPARPTFRFRDSDFWAQGINVGVEVRY